MIEVIHIKALGNMVMMRSGWQVATCSNYFMANILQVINWLDHSYDTQTVKCILTSGPWWIWEELVPAVTMSRKRAHAENATHDENVLHLLRPNVQGLQAAHGYWITEVIFIYILWIECTRKLKCNKKNDTNSTLHPGFYQRNNPPSPQFREILFPIYPEERGCRRLYCFSVCARGIK